MHISHEDETLGPPARAFDVSRREGNVKDANDANDAKQKGRSQIMNDLENSIAIVGQLLRFPKSGVQNEFCSNLVNGRDCGKMLDRDGYAGTKRALARYESPQKIGGLKIVYVKAGSCPQSMALANLDRFLDDAMHHETLEPKNASTILANVDDLLGMEAA